MKCQYWEACIETYVMGQNQGIWKWILYFAFPLYGQESCFENFFGGEIHITRQMTDVRDKIIIVVG